MAINISVNGESIDYPQAGDPGWADNATNFAIQTSSALGQLGLDTGTTVDIPGTLDVTGNTTLDANLSVAGIVNIDSGVLYVDPVNNRVGINDTSPSQALNVIGNVLISGQTLASNGTALLPGVSFASDDNTGLYRKGSDNIGFSVNGLLNGELTTNGWIISQQYACFVDEKATGTNGGTATSGSWQTKTLNTTRGTNSITGSSLSSNQFTLPQGTYRISVSSPAYFVGLHKSKLRNITDGSDVIIGTTEYTPRVGVADCTLSRSIINGTFTIASQKTFEIQHQVQTTQAGNGFGQNAGFSVVEVYTIVELWKLV